MEFIPQHANLAKFPAFRYIILIKLFNLLPVGGPLSLPAGYFCSDGAQ